MCLINILKISTWLRFRFMIRTFQEHSINAFPLTAFTDAIADSVACENIFTACSDRLIAFKLCPFKS